MKKIVSSILMLSCFLIFSCQKKIAPITNSLEANEQLDGSWVMKQVSEMDVYADPENPDSLVGTAKAKAAITLSFNTDLSYSMKFDQAFDSFIQTTEAMDFSVEDIKERISSTMTIKGTYAANESVLQLNNKSVVLKDGSEMAVEEYSKYDPSINANIIQSSWKIVDDKLSVISADGKMVAEYKKVK